MDQGNYKNTADDELGQRLLLQQQRRHISSTSLFKAPEERPYRRRIKPPATKVHHVHPARFRRFVQRRTCCPLPQQQPNDADDATASTISISATTEQELQRPPPDAATDGGSDAATAEAGRPIDATRKSMQEAYMAWCSSNDIPLSPGTMAELSFTVHPCNNNGYSC